MDEYGRIAHGTPTIQMSLKGKTLFITGGSRGIGKAIALKAAKDGANVVIAAKTTEEHPKLPGTIYSAAKEIEESGGKALAIQCDIRDEKQVQVAIAKAVECFGGIDILVNNASAISLTPTLATSMKKFDLMHQVNVRGTFAMCRAALPHLIKSKNPHILMLSPPLAMDPKWFAPHTAYTMSKYGMSMCVLGLAEEFKEKGVAVNALWPLTVIDTAALQAITPESKEMASKGRTAEIMADAAYVILNQDSRTYSGNFAIDEAVLRSQGVNDFAKYSATPGNEDLLIDFFVEDDYKFNLPPFRVNSKL